MLPTYNDAAVAFQQGSLDKSKKLCLEILKNNPKNLDTLILLSVIAFQTDNFDKSLEILNYTIKNFPEVPEALFNKAHVLYFKKSFSESLICLNRALELHNQYFECYNLKGLILVKQNNEILAIESFNNSLKINPNYFEGYKNLFNLYNETNQLDKALKILDKASENIKNNCEIHYFRSLVFDKQKKLNQAIKELDKYVEYKKDNSEVFNLRGLLYTNLNKNELAQADFAESIRLEPKKLSAYHNMGNLLKKNNKYNDAIKFYKKSIEIDELYKNGLGNYLNAKYSICNWENYDSNNKKLENFIKNNYNVCSTFHLLSIIDSPKLHFINSKLENKQYSDEINNKISLLTKKKNKIKIGYYSADFCNHPVAYQIFELIENHDREKFEVIGFSFNSKSDESKQRLISAFDSFIDVENISDEEIVNISKKMEIDIAVDLMGYTQSNRFKIFEKRCAPIQINYLGYPSTTASNNIDYIISDKHTIEKKNYINFSEKIIILPNSFMPVNTKKKLINKKIKRIDYGLSNNSFVLCCFSKFYKITPKIFNIWINILKKFEKTTLWLSLDNIEGFNNLTNLLESKNIDKKRIIFAKSIKNKDDHINRLRLADLCLDTYPYGSHSTCCDYLIAGLPIITIKGQSFSSSVSSSILNSMNLNELISNNFDEYEKKITKLILEPDYVKNIKKKIEVNKIESSFFNMKLYTSNIEKAYNVCISKHYKKLSPDNIYID